MAPLSHRPRPVTTPCPRRHGPPCPRCVPGYHAGVRPARWLALSSPPVPARPPGQAGRLPPAPSPAAQSHSTYCANRGRRRGSPTPSRAWASGWRTQVGHSRHTSRPAAGWPAPIGPVRSPLGMVLPPFLMGDPLQDHLARNPLVVTSPALPAGGRPGPTRRSGQRSAETLRRHRTQPGPRRTTSRPSGSMGSRPRNGRPNCAAIASAWLGPKISYCLPVSGHTK